MSGDAYLVASELDLGGITPDADPRRSGVVLRHLEAKTTRSVARPAGTDPFVNQGGDGSDTALSANGRVAVFRSDAGGLGLPAGSAERHLRPRPLLRLGDARQPRRGRAAVHARLRSRDQRGRPARGVLRRHGPDRPAPGVGARPRGGHDRARQPGGRHGGPDRQRPVARRAPGRRRHAGRLPLAGIEPGRRRRRRARGRPPPRPRDGPDRARERRRHRDQGRRALERGRHRRLRHACVVQERGEEPRRRRHGHLRRRPPARPGRGHDEPGQQHPGRDEGQRQRRRRADDRRRREPHRVLEHGDEPRRRLHRQQGVPPRPRGRHARRSSPRAPGGSSAPTAASWPSWTSSPGRCCATWRRSRRKACHRRAGRARSTTSARRARA